MAVQPQVKKSMEKDKKLLAILFSEDLTFLYIQLYGFLEIMGGARNIQLYLVSRAIKDMISLL